MDLVAIDLARLATVCEGSGIGLHGGPVTTQVDYLLVEPQPPWCSPQSPAWISLRILVPS